MSQLHVIIFMATYNGQRFLAQQLDSIIAQTHKNWELWISDDGSSDETCDILTQYQNKLGDSFIHILKGPQKGFAVNFLSLMANPQIKADYYAYSDQDDYWESTKLERALEKLENLSDGGPLLYCSRTKFIDAEGTEIGYSTLSNKKSSFLNALVQNIAGGNTMVFNHKAFELLRQTVDQQHMVAHDWWTYLLIAGAGGGVFYDPVPYIRYRQHAMNLIGSNSGVFSFVFRLKSLFMGRFKKWNDWNCEALATYSHLLTEENKQVLQDFTAARNDSFFDRLINVKKLGLYRQTLLGNLGLTLAVLFNKI